MRDMIQVRPDSTRRQEFARWATAQTPKIRTVAPATFAVPAGLFVDAPEDILIGALVDGRRYVSPYEVEADEDLPTELVGVAGPETFVPMRTAVPGEPLPEVPAEAYGPDSVPLDPPDFAPLEDAPADDDGPAAAGAGSEADEAAAPGHECAACEITYASARSLTRHRRRVHHEGA